MQTKAHVSSIAIGTLLLGLAMSTALVGCQTTPRDQSDRATLRSDAQSAMTTFHSVDPTLQGLLDRAEGWAVYPSVGRAGFLAGGSFGRGIVYDGSGNDIGFSAIRQGTVGLQAGAQSFRQLVVFLTPSAWESFKTGTFEFAANMSAVAATSGGGASADWSGGVVVFVESQSGLMAELSVGGQQISFERW